MDVKNMGWQLIGGWNPSMTKVIVNVIVNSLYRQ